MGFADNVRVLEFAGYRYVNVCPSKKKRSSAVEVRRRGSRRGVRIEPRRRDGVVGGESRLLVEYELKRRPSVLESVVEDPRCGCGWVWGEIRASRDRGLGLCFMFF